MKKRYLLLAIILFSAKLSYSQQCGFDVERSELRKNPSYVALEKASEQRIQQVIKKRKTSAKKSNTSVLNIPIVVHVLHLGETEGTGSNISDAQIQSSIDNLNDFYRGNTANSPEDFEIEFALAQRDPDNNNSTGINRIDATSLTGYSDNGVNVNNANGASYSEIKNLISWPQTDYFNIWIVTELDNNGGGSGFQGYAYFYSESSSNYGSVMMSSVFGYDPGNTNGWGLNSNGDNSTVVHEVGHYFHLYHTFQGDDSDSDGVSDRCPDDADVGDQSDGCADTETHQRETSTCPSTNTCSGSDWLDNNTINNIMSYYNCTDRLTADQKTRARAAMEETAIINSKGSEIPDENHTAPVAVCSINSATNQTSYVAGILNVELNGANFGSFSTKSDSGNIDKSANSVNFLEIDPTTTNTLNVTMYGANFQQLGVWIDWNDDGDFDDEAEQQHLSEDIASDSVISVTLSLPTNIPYNDYVRIRLITELDDRHGTSTIDSSCFSTLIYGQSEDYAIFVESPFATWTGNVGTNWSTSSNWYVGIPGTGDDVTIPNTTNKPIINSDVTVSNLTVESGSSLDVSSIGSLTISENLTNNGTLTVNSTASSSASLIVSGIATGNITYTKFIGTDWQLLSAPVTGQTYDDTWVSENAIASGSINGNHRGVGVYNNDSGSWDYMLAGTSNTFTQGIGYSILRTISGNISFNGVMATGDVSFNLSEGTATNYNLISGVFLSFIPANINADASQNFLTTNTTSLEEETIWVWDGTSYSAKNQVSDAVFLFPGESFFVKAKVDQSNVTFLKAMQKIQSKSEPPYPNGGFKTAAKSEIRLFIDKGNEKKYTDIFYLNSTTENFDNGYDSSLYAGVSSDFEIYTKLVNQEKDMNLAIQSLPKDYSIVVPVGVIIAANSDVEFRISSYIPEGQKVYLEDRQLGIYTLLENESDAYKITIEDALNGSGRFFIHTTNKALSSVENSVADINLYYSNKNLHIKNLPSENSLITIFDILGKEVFKQKLNKTQDKLSVKELSDAIYIVKVETDKGNFIRKICIQ